MTRWVAAVARAVTAAARDAFDEVRRDRPRRRRRRVGGAGAAWDAGVATCSVPGVAPRVDHVRHVPLEPVPAAAFAAARPGLRWVWLTVGPEVVIADVPLPDGTVGALVATPTTSGLTLRIDRGPLV